ncbi:ABC transporter permease [Arthrobacter sp. H14-L1]|uniref:ABC transporter permease n=1 Tax=Arthrobacter sp. H14-L1 TaxID=2996697 RepID=UPI00226F72DA|nr:ABC transporter permease [Arthrobacter sp. H14-L1]MCY0905033.1 ABC transporter permease [Arthrobacter sp. H14-L1]
MSMVEDAQVLPVTPKAQKRTNRPTSRGRLIFAKLARTPRFWVGTLTLLVIVLWALFGLAFYAYNATSQDVMSMNTAPTGNHWFGTDEIGGDIYAQTVVGLRKSLLIGFVVGPVSALLAGFIGALAGYLGGVWDRVIVWFIDLLLVLPALYILIMLYPLIKGGSWVIVMVYLAIFSWMILARVIRAQTSSLRDRDFVKAARFMGVKTSTIIRRHIIPNVSSLLIIDATLGVGAAILTETTLSYFGFGVQPPDVSLGTLLSSGTGAATTRPWLFIFPAAILVITVLATSLAGDALRDAVDPTSGANRD